MTSPEQEQRIRQAIEMRNAGHTYRDIADTMGYANPGTVHHLITNALRRETTASVEDYVNQELSRLDALLVAHWDTATTPGRGKNGVMNQTRAAAIVLRIGQRKAKLLGLDDYERRLLELAERRAKLDEQDARLAMEFFQRVLARLDLTDEQWDLVASAMPQELEAVTAREQRPLEIEGEEVDDGEG